MDLFLWTIVGANSKECCLFTFGELARTIEANAVGGFGAIFRSAVAESSKFF